MGYRFLHDYVHGKHVYIDDLVTTAAIRSQGAGAKLLKYAEMIAESARLSESLGLNRAISLQNNYSMLARGTEKLSTIRAAVERHAMFDMLSHRDIPIFLLVQHDASNLSLRITPDG